MSNYHISFAQKENPGEELTLDTLAIKKSALILRAFNHKLRQQILKLIDTQEKVTVTEIYVKLRIEQSVASQHLAILRKADFVKTERDGKFIYYTVNTDRMKDLNQFVGQLLS
ncbi:ArsR/SmtB family transcription factor [Niabella ginsengisoli]|uniref:Metalloregulator ArsR/SmtB family transcription factor n=1 Tax=Niabella ginsengisoli TaxID=522298 RepID=A0ABS9SPM1_9BACT|nr:metalloregulator ArsR/SmtB family transcription factor [Niabella ginsengisoli]MCH5600315.1 metalloregulator ArsR/SmtB family transcription factor [Niabella ginsengisoli]